MKVFISPLAETHLDDIYEYYLFYNEKTAYHILSEIKHTLFILSENPKAGKKEVSLFYKGYTVHSLTAYKGMYRIIYYFDIDILYILAIWDCRRNPEKLINEIK